MRSVMRDPELEQKFQADGYIEVPFISEKEVGELKQKFFEMQAISGGNITASDVKSEITYDFTFIDKNPAFKKAVFDTITSYFEPHVAKWLQDYRPLIANFIRKDTDGGEVPLHQNWAFADEKKCTTVSIWCPLVDSNEANGTLQVVPHSHKRFGEFRGPLIPWELEGIKKDIIEKYLVPCNVKAGNAIILDDSIVHYSAINKTNDLRLAIQLILIPKEFESIHYHANSSDGEGRVSALEVDVDFYLNFNPWKRPEGEKVIKTFKHTPAPLKLDEFEKRLKGKRFDEAPLPMIPLFKDDEKQREFDQNGFIRLPALTPHEVSVLLDHYKSLDLQSQPGYPLVVSLDQSDKSNVHEIVKKLLEVSLPSISKHFKNFKAVTATYIIKEPHNEHVFPVHHDWTVVDEEGPYCSLNCWIPLVDTSLDNGAIGAIKGSHLFIDNPRPSPYPKIPTVLSQQMHGLFPYLNIAEMKAGEMFVFDNRTFHGSTPNFTDKPRIAIGIGITQLQSRLVHYFYDPKDPSYTKVLKYEVDEGFFLKYSNSELTKLYDAGQTIEGYRLISELPFEHTALSNEKLIDLVVENGNAKDSRLADMVETPVKQDVEVSNLGGEADVSSHSADIETGDNRSFFEKYTFRNILGEIKLRIQSI